MSGPPGTAHYPNRCRIVEDNEKWYIRGATHKNSDNFTMYFDPISYSGEKGHYNFNFRTLQNVSCQYITEESVPKWKHEVKE